MKKVKFSAKESKMLGKSLANFKNQTIQELAKEVYGAGVGVAKDTSISWLRIKQ